MWPFLLIIVLLAVNGFFVALEFALVGSRRSRLEPLADAGDRSAIRALAAMKELSIQLAGAQLGITVASLLLGLNWFGNVGVRMFGVEPKDELSDTHSAQELAVLVSVSHEEGAIPDFSAELLSGVLDFGQRTVASVMVARESVAAVSIEATPRELEEAVRELGHTRLLVVGDGGIDDVRGFLHAKDLLTVPDSEIDNPVPSRLVRPTLETDCEKRLEDLLKKMQSTRVHFATVYNDDESTAGIVTLDDLLEELLSDLTEED